MAYKLKAFILLTIEMIYGIIGCRKSNAHCFVAVECLLTNTMSRFTATFDLNWDANATSNPRTVRFVKGSAIKSIPILSLTKEFLDTHLTD